MRALRVAATPTRRRVAWAALIVVLSITALVRVLHEVAAGHIAHAAIAVLVTGAVLCLLGWLIHGAASRLDESIRLLDALERERATRDRFLAEVVRAQDLEARRIAELLHDDAVQRLTALGLRLELAAMRSGEQSLKELATEAGAVTASIRRLLVDLHPAVLETRGIAAAVDGAAESLRAAGVEVAVGPLDLRLVPEHEHLAYRLVQEALANALAHADASRVEVVFEADSGTFRCRVDDDGRGFAAGAVAEQSMGLHLARERIDLAGGAFAIGARKAGGTSFSFELPLRPRETEPKAETEAAA